MTSVIQQYSISTEFANLSCTTIGGTRVTHIVVRQNPHHHHVIDLGQYRRTESRQFHHPVAAGPRAHLCNGFYVNAVFDRLLRTDRTGEAASRGGIAPDVGTIF